MRKLTMAMATVSVLVTAGSAGAQGRFLPAPAAGIPGEYLVMLSEGSVRGPEELPGAGPSVEETAANLAGRYGGEVVQTYSYGASGFLVRLDEARARALAAEPGVLWVQQNRRVAAFERPAPGTPLIPRQSGPGLLALSGGGSPQPIDCVDPDPRIPGNFVCGVTDPAYDCVDNWVWTGSIKPVPSGTASTSTPPPAAGCTPTSSTPECGPTTRSSGWVASPAPHASGRGGT